MGTLVRATTCSALLHDTHPATYCVAELLYDRSNQFEFTSLVQCRPYLRAPVPATQRPAELQFLLPLHLLLCPCHNLHLAPRCKCLVGRALGRRRRYERCGSLRRPACSTDPRATRSSSQQLRNSGRHTSEGCALQRRMCIGGCCTLGGATGRSSQAYACQRVRSGHGRERASVQVRVI